MLYQLREGVGVRTNTEKQRNVSLTQFEGQRTISSSPTEWTTDFDLVHVYTC